MTAVKVHQTRERRDHWIRAWFVGVETPANQHRPWARAAPAQVTADVHSPTGHQLIEADRGAIQCVANRVRVAMWKDDEVPFKKAMVARNAVDIQPRFPSSNVVKTRELASTN